MGWSARGGRFSSELRFDRRSVPNRGSVALGHTPAPECVSEYDLARELHQAIKAGLKIYIWYVGLASPELHIARVRARVGRGGHEIPEAKIRERYPKSLANLVSFIGVAAQVHLFDNSAESANGLPQTMRVFRMRGERIIEPDLETLMVQTPNWAKPVVAAAVKVHTARRKARKKK